MQIYCNIVSIGPSSCLILCYLFRQHPTRVESGYLLMSIVELPGIIPMRIIVLGDRTATGSELL